MSTDTHSAEPLTSCPRLPGEQRCIEVRRCDDTSRPIATLDGYWLTNVPEGTYKKPHQHTVTTLCYDNAGIRIAETATDRYPDTHHTKCNSYVWEKSPAMEVFIFPVATPYDVPQYYYEVDLAPSGAAYVSLIHNKDGNTTNCGDCVPGERECRHANFYPNNPTMELAAEYITNEAGRRVGWRTQRLLPFLMFHALGSSTRMFRFNLYRYSYPYDLDGPMELSAYSPTWNPSFHVPSRFGLMVLV